MVCLKNIVLLITAYYISTAWFNTWQQILLLYIGLLQNLSASLTTAD